MTHFTQQDNLILLHESVGKNYPIITNLVSVVSQIGCWDDSRCWRLKTKSMSLQRVNSFAYCGSIDVKPVSSSPPIEEIFQQRGIFNALAWLNRIKFSRNNKRVKNLF